MSNFLNFSRLFGNNSTPESRRLRRRSRICRIEELEGREMLSVTPWTLVDDVTFTEPQSLDCVYDVPSPFGGGLGWGLLTTSKKHIKPSP